MIPHFDQTPSSTPATRERLVKPAELSEVEKHIPLDYLRCAVPVACGGFGGDVLELSILVRHLNAECPAAALRYWGQRMAIEFLVQASNVALREFLLPDLLNFHRAATVPFNFSGNSVEACNAGSALLLNGDNLLAANAPPGGFSFLCPIRFSGVSIGWGVVRSEEQGFNLESQMHSSVSYQALAAKIELRNFFFRSDELLGEDALHNSVSPVEKALDVIRDPHSSAFRAIQQMLLSGGRLEAPA